MRTKPGVTLAFGLLIIWGAAIPSQADSIVFSNLGPGDSYQGGSGYTVGNLGAGGGYRVYGFAFTVGATSTDLGTIGVAVGFVTGTNQLTINLDADSGGSPGSVIESFTLNGAMPPFGTYSMGNLVTATSVLHPLLTAGSQYWVVVSVPNDGTSQAAWALNSTGDMGPFAIYSNGTEIVNGTGLRGAMLITGVPEPSSIVMVSISAVVILGCGLRRRGRAKTT
jgi:hypothetical protein